MAMTKEEKRILEIGSKKNESHSSPVPQRDPKDVLLEETIVDAIAEKGMGVHVIVRDGQVILSGSAKDRQEKALFLQTVNAIPEIKGVTNHIRIRSLQD